jgi:hypothetical protein
MIQTFFNSDGTGLTAIITVIVDGDHVDPDSWPITNDPAIVLSSHPAASKTVTAIDTGVFKVVWSSLSPALAHGDVVFIAVDGDISATAWTTWQIPVQVVHLPAKSSDVTTALEDMELDKALIAQGAERAVNVDVNHRVHSHVYDMQANTITASALAADAGAEIYAAFGTGSNLTALATQASVNDIPTNAEFAAAFPANFASLGINVSGHVSRVTLVDTTTANTDMRGTDSALTDKAGFALSATGLDLVTAWTTDITGSLSGNVGGIAGTINTLDELDTAQDTQHGTTQDRLGYTLAALAGACADAGTAAETYAITIGVDTYTIDHTGLDATGNRGTATLTKS